MTTWVVWKVSSQCSGWWIGLTAMECLLLGNEGTSSRSPNESPISPDIKKIKNKINSEPFSFVLLWFFFLNFKCDLTFLFFSIIICHLKAASYTWKFNSMLTKIYKKRTLIEEKGKLNFVLPMHWSLTQGKWMKIPTFWNQVELEILWAKVHSLLCPKDSVLSPWSRPATNLPDTNLSHPLPCHHRHHQSQNSCTFFTLILLLLLLSLTILIIIVIIIKTNASNMMFQFLNANFR